MSPSSEALRLADRAVIPPALLCGLGAVLCGAVALAGAVRHGGARAGPGLADYFLARQDVPVLTAMAGLLLLMTLALGMRRRRAPGTLPSLYRKPYVFGWPILLGIVMAAVLARAGRTLVFHGISLSRDELMVELAGAYLAQGQVGWRIPAEWAAYSRAILPEYFSPYGADTHWTSIYLPVHAAIRALAIHLGDGALAAPAMLAIGLVALWRVAARLLPTRPDAQAVAVLMALTSTQLVVTAMTPFAMTSHFALNLLWLTLLLRGDRIGHGAAALVALLAAGLHQWHFPILFIGPFLLWLLLRGQWRAALWHGAVLIVVIVLWARLWPLALTEMVGPAPLTDAHRTNGIFDKLESLLGRLDAWQPLHNNARLIAWNHALLLPLALMAPLAVRWRGRLRDLPVVLPLLAGAIGGMGLALFQGYGWGFRYMAGQLGPLCLLAGIGWCAISSRHPRLRVAMLGTATAGSLVAGLWLAQDTRAYVQPYARAIAAMRAAPADVVLVDLRGGYYMTDLVRFRDGRPGRPMMMALHWLTPRQLDDLCARYRVAIMDKSQFWPLGVHRTGPRFRGSERVQALREHLAARRCGVPVLPAARGGAGHA